MTDQVTPVVPASADAPKVLTVPEDLLDIVTREDGSRKYQTLEDLAKGAAHAQAHIATLTQELEALRTGKDKSALEKLLNQETPVTPVVPAVANQPQAVSIDDVEKAVLAITARNTAQANANAIKADLIKLAGSEEAAAKLFQDKAAQAGLTVQDLTDLAAKSPVAARAILGTTAQAAPSKTHSSISTGTIPAIEEPRTRVMLGGATTSQLVEAFRKHKPKE